MSRRDDPAPAQAAQPRWSFDASIPTSDFLAELRPDEWWGLQEAVESFIYEMEEDRFLTWEAVVCQEQGLSLTAEQRGALHRLIDFSNAADSDRILYIDELPRPSEPWYVILNRIVPHLLKEPFVTSSMYGAVIMDGWPRLMEAVRKHGPKLSLPPGVTLLTEIVPADLRHRMWLQVCFDGLYGLGQEDQLNLQEQAWRMEEFIGHLREHKASVEYFGLTLESLLTRVGLPERDKPIFVRMMQEGLGLPSLQHSIAEQL